MRLRLTLTALTLSAASLTGCAGPVPSTAPTLTWSPPPVLALALPCLEDAPCWDCRTMGNHACGPVTEDAAAAWRIFDHGGGAAMLPVDPSSAYRVDFMGAGDDYPRGFNALTDAAAVGKDGRWYWFRATYPTAH